jgi:hypothetical protein
MLRTVFMIGLFAVLGLFVLKLAFGILAGLLGVFAGLVKMAIVVAIIGAAIYLVVRIVSPDTARRLRERWSGSSAM